MHLKDNKGALVMDGVKNSPAAGAGLKKDHLVVAYHGKPIDDAAALQSSVGDTPVGGKVGPTVLRDEKNVDLTVRIGNMEDAMNKIAAALEDRLGVVVRPLTADESERYGLQPGQGVAIASLSPKGVLAKAGFEKNDVIVAVNNTPVEGVEGFVSLGKALPPHQQAVFNAVGHHTGQSGYAQITVG